MKLMIDAYGGKYFMKNSELEQRLKECSYRYRKWMNA